MGTRSKEASEEALFIARLLALNVGFEAAAAGFGARPLGAGAQAVHDALAALQEERLLERYFRALTEELSA